MTARPGSVLGVGFDGTALPEDVVALAETSGLGAVILFARNCPTLDTVLALTGACRRWLPEALVLVDHEGGRVHRLPPPFTRFPAAAVVARSGDAALVRAVARAMARELRAAGFDSGLAPVLDCLTEPGATAIGDRAFGVDPERVAACGEAFVRATVAEGVIPVAKHFPGHGRTAIDSHATLPEVEAPLALLETVELLPFRRALAAGCPAVLVAHVRYLAIDGEWPASLSAAAIDGLLRGRLGFGGCVLSDDLEMRAVAERVGVAEAAVRFLAAGGDLALVCRDRDARQAAVAHIRAALDAGRLSLGTARARLGRLRELRAVTGPDPGVEVIGCREHRALVDEVLGRAAG